MGIKESSYDCVSGSFLYASGIYKFVDDICSLGGMASLKDKN